MERASVMPLQFQPGIQKDGSPTASPSCIDGDGVRFYKGLPKKIGGLFLKELPPSITDPIVNIFQSHEYFGSKTIFVLGTNQPKGLYVYDNGVVRPADFTSNVPEVTTDGGWFCELGYAQNDFNHPTTHFSNVYPTLCFVYVGDRFSSAGPKNNAWLFFADKPFNSTTGLRVSSQSSDYIQGGIIYSSPTLLSYSKKGILTWSSIDTLLFSESAFYSVVAPDGILAIRTCRGSSSPQMLLWTDIALYTVVYTPTAGSDDTPSKPNYMLTTVEGNISILGPHHCCNT